MPYTSAGLSKDDMSSETKEKKAAGKRVGRAVEPEEAAAAAAGTVAATLEAIRAWLDGKGIEYEVIMGDCIHAPHFLDGLGISDGKGGTKSTSGPCHLCVSSLCASVSPCAKSNRRVVTVQ